MIFFVFIANLVKSLSNN